jgi:hypothetical protein
VNRPSGLRTARRLTVALTLGVAALTSIAAPPAAAHNISRNYVTAITRVYPSVSGLQVSAMADGTYLTIANHTGETVIVFGYANEPYLRLTDEGVWQNTLSLTTYVNASVVRDVPAEVNANAPPVWEQVSDSTTYQFHDHRVDWNGTGRPAVVDADPGSPHLIARWTIRLRVGHTPVRVEGTLSWKPSPSGLPGMGVVLAIVGAMLFAAFIFAIVLDARRNRADDDDDRARVPEHRDSAPH